MLSKDNLTEHQVTAKLSERSEHNELSQTLLTTEKFLGSNERHRFGRLLIQFISQQMKFIPQPNLPSPCQGRESPHTLVSSFGLVTTGMQE